MLMMDTPITTVIRQVDISPSNDELNRLLCAAVVSKSFRNILLTHPEVALSSGYQGETFNLSPEDQNWLYSIRPSNIVDLAANMVTYQQERKVRIPIEAVPQMVQVN
jgi:hypothetical protein